MKQPGTILEHGGDSYLLVEGGYNDDTRSVTLLSRPGNPHFPHDPGERPIRWRDQGEWFPLARWSVGLVELQHSEHEGSRDLLGEVLARYLEEHVVDPVAAWALVGDSGFRGTLEEVIPMGVAVPLFDDRERAVELAKGGGVEPVRNVARFLTQLAREGYAGAMWNGEVPVFFCIDEDGELQFLRVRRGDSGKVELDLLDPLKGWEAYDGAESIEFLDNRDACDARLVAALGHRPVLGWPGVGGLWSVGPRTGEPGVVESEEDGLRYGLLFGSQEAADAWRAEIDEPWTSWPVPDLLAFLRHEALDACGGGLLNPGEHRARSGILWSDGRRVVLDAFSGFWALEDDSFIALDDEEPADERDGD